MSKTKLLFYSCLTGVLLFLSWPPFGFPFLLFFAFVPLLIVEDAFSGETAKAKRVFLFALSYFAFFIWNALTTWWIWNASPGGACLAIFANSFLMAAVFWIFHLVKKRFSVVQLPFVSYFLFPFFWIAFEFFHLRWELAWPWLTIGNAFAKNHIWVQWYEYTGTLGGSLWVLVVNLMVFRWFRVSNFSNKMYGHISGIVSMIFLPIIISYIIYYSYEEKNNPVKVVAVQPNIDPYSEKFSGMNFE
ncbi:MAG: apolipoprotein N-acyltransferase, partial [Bacteroidota bacterium]